MFPFSSVISFVDPGADFSSIVGAIVVASQCSLTVPYILFSHRVRLAITMYLSDTGGIFILPLSSVTSVYV